MKLFNLERSEGNFKALSMDWKQYVTSIALKLNAQADEYVSTVEAMSANELSSITKVVTSIGVVDLYQVQQYLHDEDFISDSAVIDVYDSATSHKETVSNIMQALHNDNTARKANIDGLNALATDGLSNPIDLSNRFAQLNGVGTDPLDDGQQFWYRKVLNVLADGRTTCSDKLHLLINNFTNIDNPEPSVPSSWDDVMTLDEQQYGSPAAAAWYEYDWSNFWTGIWSYMKWNFNTMLSVSWGIIKGVGSVIKKGFDYIFHNTVVGDKLAVVDGEVSTFAAGGWKITIDLDDSTQQSHPEYDFFDYYEDKLAEGRALRMDVPFGELYLTEVHYEDDPDPQYGSRQIYTLYFKPKYVQAYYRPWFNYSSAGFIGATSVLPKTNTSTTAMINIWNGIVGRNSYYDWFDKTFPNGMDIKDDQTIIDVCQRYKWSTAMFVRWASDFGQYGDDFDIHASLSSGNDFYSLVNTGTDGFDLSSAFTYTSSASEVVSGVLMNAVNLENCSVAILKLLKYVKEHDDDVFQLSYDWVLAPTQGQLVVTSNESLRQNFLTGVKAIGIIVGLTAAMIIGIKAWKKLGLAITTAQTQMDRFAFDESVEINAENMLKLKKMGFKVTLLNTLKNGIVRAATIAPAATVSLASKIGSNEGASLQTIADLITG